MKYFSLNKSISCSQTKNDRRNRSSTFILQTRLFLARQKKDKIVDELYRYPENLVRPKLLTPPKSISFSSRPNLIGVEIRTLIDLSNAEILQVPVCQIETETYLEKKTLQCQFVKKDIYGSTSYLVLPMRCVCRRCSATVVLWGCRSRCRFSWGCCC